MVVTSLGAAKLENHGPSIKSGYQTHLLSDLKITVMVEHWYGEKLKILF